jgi:hypothetical protein
MCHCPQRWLNLLRWPDFRAAAMSEKKAAPRVAGLGFYEEDASVGVEKRLGATDQVLILNNSRTQQAKPDFALFLYTVPSSDSLISWGVGPAGRWVKGRAGDYRSMGPPWGTRLGT